MSGKAKLRDNVLVLGLLTLVGLSSPLTVQAQGVYANYIPYFPTSSNNTTLSLDESPQQPTRWLGGDGAVETRLDATHSLWFFADSLISNNRQQGRYNGVYPATGSSINYSTARNSIAIATHSRVGDQYQFVPQYYCRGRAGAYTAFFPDTSPMDPRSGRSGWLWPRSALTQGPFILLFANRMVEEPGGETRTNNTIILRIDTRPGPTDPSRWILTPLYVHRYPEGESAEIVFGASSFLIKEGATTYVGTYSTYPRLNIVTGMKIPLDSLLNAPAYTDVSLPYQGNTGAQYLKDDSTWAPGLYGTGALAVKNIPTDFYFTTRFVPDSGSGSWRAVLFQNKSLYGYNPSRTFTYPAPPAAGPIPSPTPPADCLAAYLTTSTTGPYGPFATPTPLARFPQMDPGNAISYHPDILCYGVAEQPDFETTDSQILLTYNTHSNVAMLPASNSQRSYLNIFNNPSGQFYTIFSQYSAVPPK